MHTEAIDLCPDNATYLGYRSTCLRKMGDNANALIDSRKARELNSRRIQGCYHTIECCLSLGNINGAEKAIQSLAHIGSNKDICDKYGKKCEQLRQFLKCYEKNKFQKAGKWNDKPLNRFFELFSNLMLKSCKYTFSRPFSRGAQNCTSLFKIQIDEGRMFGHTRTG